MRNETIRTRILTAALFGFAGAALAAPPAPVEFKTTVNAIHVVPASNPLPGLHVDAKVNGRAVDIYIAPMAFVTKYDVKVEKGELADIVGTEQDGVFLAREITTGVYDRQGAWRPNMTIHLRNDDGPFWEQGAH